MDHKDRTEEPAMTDIESNGQVFPLVFAQPGQRLRIAAHKSSKGLGRKLSTLGLAVGSAIEVTQRTPRGGVVVAHDSARIALGTRIAQQVLVHLAEPVEQGG